MLKGSDIKLGADLAMPMSICEQPDPFILQLSDALAAKKSALPVQFRDEIAKFVNKSAIWFPATVARLKKESMGRSEISLLQIHILSEPADELIFGLEFWVSYDTEHGRGFKIRGATLEIIESGLGEVSFT